MSSTKNIHVIRDSIGKIVSMLTSQSITVTQRGSKAYVAYNKITGAIANVNIPYLPDDATDEFIGAVQGFLDHEVGHVLFTDPKTVTAAAKAGGRVANLANVIEDVYIERKMTEAFAGSESNLEAVRKFYLYKVGSEKIKASLAEGDIQGATGRALVIAMRAWGGQGSAQEFIKDKNIAKLLEPVIAKLGPDLIAAIGKCNSSTDCLALARKFKTALEDVEPSVPKTPPPPPPMTSKKPSPEEASAPPPGEVEDRDDAKPESGEGGPTKKSMEVDESGKDSKDSKAESPTATDSEEGVTPPDPASSGPGEAPESGSPVEDDEPDSPEKPDGEPESPSKPEDSEGGKTGSGSGEEEESSATDASPATASDDKGDGRFEGSHDAPELPPEPKEDMGGLFDEKRDFDDEASEALSEAAKTALSKSDYRVFSPDWDVVVPAPPAVRATSLAMLEDGVTESIGVMQKQLERALFAMDKKAWNPAQRRGRIHPGGLFKVATGDDRVFRTRHETRAKNTAVSLVIDCSGSMAGERIKTAGKAAFALSTVLDRLKIVHEVIGFTTYDSFEMQAAMNAEEAPGTSRRRSGWGRDQALYHPVFKGFHERLCLETKTRLAKLVERPDYMENNVDGESIQLMGHRLLKQKAERHVMMVLSDGQPAASGDTGNLRTHLKKVIKELTERDIEMIGIGIQSEAVKDYYPKSVVLSRIEDLPTVVIGQLTKLLLGQ